MALPTSSLAEPTRELTYGDCELVHGGREGRETNLTVGLGGLVVRHGEWI